MHGMRNTFENLSRNNTLLSIVMVVLGLVLIIWPGQTLDLAARILGIALLLGAAISGYSWYRDRHKVGAGYATLAVALLCLILGIIVLVASRGIISLLPRLIGIAIIINGIMNVAQAFMLKSADIAGWTSSMVMAVLTVLVGVLIVGNAFGIMTIGVMAIGVAFIYNGISNLWIESKCKKM